MAPGSVAVITGAASGIGAALAQTAASRGMRLVLTDVNAAGLERTRDLCTAAEVVLVKTDVAEEADVVALADAAWDAFSRVDLLCNNAGIGPAGRHRPVWEYSAQDWQWAFSVNVFGMANGLRAFVPRLLAQGSGHILNTASVSGFISGAGSPVYSATKHAVVRLSEALYASLRERDAPIGVTMLCPGLVKTAFFDGESARPTALRNSVAVEEAPELQGVAAGGADPHDVARQAFEAIEADRFYAFTTNTFDEMIAARTRDVIARSNPQFLDFAALSFSDFKKPERA